MESNNLPFLISHTCVFVFNSQSTSVTNRLPKTDEIAQPEKESNMWIGSRSSSSSTSNGAFGFRVGFTFGFAFAAES